MLDFDFEMTNPDLNLNMACDGEFYEPQAIVSSPIVPIDRTVSMECDDDTVSPSVFPEAVNTMSCEMMLSSDLDPQRHAIENDCNSNTVCHAWGILDCQCTQQQTGDHNYASYRPSVQIHKRTGVQLTRKRRKNCSEWKAVKRKKLRQQGKVYVMSTGAMAKAKAMQRCTRDHEDCRFKCATNFDEVSRQIIHTQHWSLIDDDKRQFYINTTTSQCKARTRRAENCNKKRLVMLIIFFTRAKKFEYAKIFI